jgi:hypothetical protein
MTYLAADKMKYELDLESAINTTPIDTDNIKYLLEKIAINELMVQKWQVLVGPDENNNENHGG